MTEKDTVSSEVSITDLLAGLTHEATERKLDTIATYQQFVEGCNPWPPTHYFSTTITSGGFSRSDSKTPAIHPVQANSAVAAQLGNVIASEHGLMPHEYVIPSHLGYIPHWGQADYLLFWLHVLQGVPANLTEVLRDIEQQTREARLLDIDLINDKLASPDDKWPAYERLVLEYISSGLRNDMLMRQSRPIRSVIFMVDTEQSLGCRAERLFAEGIGSKTYRLAEGVKPLASGLLERLEELDRLGAEVAVPSRTFHLVDAGLTSHN